MSEAAAGLIANAKPKARRLWMLVAIIALMIGSGTYWWVNRLTTDEQIFVGRWELYCGPSLQATQIILEYHDNRISQSISGKRIYWSANEGQFCVLDDRAVHKRVLDLFDRMLGRGGIPPKIVQHYEIVNRDKINISRIEAPSTTVAILQRVVEK